MSTQSALEAQIHAAPAQKDRGPGLRATLALREFVLGNLNLMEASQLAGVSDVEFIGLISHMESLQNLKDLDLIRAAADHVPAPRISVVVPVYDEQANLPALHDRLAPVLSGLGRYEIIFVDDGSSDGSVPIILELQKKDPGVKLIRFSRNFGHQAALSAGIDQAQGDALIIMDADLQDPPELLPELVNQWEAGFQVVYAVRQKRAEGLFKRGTAAAFYRLLRTVANVDIPVDTGDFCLMDRAVVDVLRALPEKNRFLRGLRSWAGFRQTGVPYDRPARHAGEAKFTLRKMVRLAVDGVMAFTSLPLRLASYLGFLTVLAGFAYLSMAMVARMTSGAFPDGWTSLVAIILIIGGAQLMILGILGAYVARIYEETKDRPMYIIDETEVLGQTAAR